MLYEEAWVGSWLLSETNWVVADGITKWDVVTVFSGADLGLLTGLNGM